MTIRLARTIALFALASAAAACHDATGPADSRAAVAGIYLLASVNGAQPPSSDPYAPVSGTIYLWPTGHAQRRTSYRLSDGRTEENTGTGTFRIEDGTVVLDLVYQPGAQPWSLTGTIDGTSLTFVYPGPADGTIVERYRRL